MDLEIQVPEDARIDVGTVMEDGIASIMGLVTTPGVMTTRTTITDGGIVISGGLGSGPLLELQLSDDH